MGDWQPVAIVRILVKHLFMKSIQFSLMAILAVLTLGAVAQEETASKFYIKAYAGYHSLPVLVYLSFFYQNTTPLL